MLPQLAVLGEVWGEVYKLLWNLRRLTVNPV